MSPEQAELNRVYTYHYKNMDEKHAIAWKQSLLKNGRATKKSDEFTDIVNYIKRKNFPFKYSVEKKFLQ